jgi:hypothetical protein
MHICPPNYRFFASGPVILPMMAKRVVVASRIFDDHSGLRNSRQ